MLILLTLLIAYLLGSINPAYFLGRYLKGIDIRKYGDENAGTTNVKHVLGIGPAVITGIFDTSKGLLSMAVAHLLGVNLFFVYLAGLVSIVGHVFPFYLKFKGGKGAATAVGLLLFFIFKFFSEGYLPLSVLFLWAVYVPLISFVVKRAELIGIFVMPFLLASILCYHHWKPDLLTLFSSLIILFLFFLNLVNAFKKRLLVIKPQVKKECLYWRALLRPLAIIFPLLYLYWDKKVILLLIGIVGLPFLLVDASRLSIKKFNQLLYRATAEIFRQKEYKKFSSMTLFLLACFFTILIFPKNLAILAIIFLIFGDLVAKVFGLQFGKTKFFQKTLEGSSAYFLACFLIGFFLSPYLDFNLPIILIGALGASLAESLPFGIDDNFIVPLLSATLMWLVKSKILS